MHYRTSTKETLLGRLAWMHPYVVGLARLVLVPVTLPTAAGRNRGLPRVLVAIFLRAHVGHAPAAVALVAPFQNSVLSFFFFKYKHSRCLGDLTCV
jgi:hypothetical protein